MTWGLGKPSALHSTRASEPWANALSVGSRIQRGGTVIEQRSYSNVLPAHPPYRQLIRKSVASWSWVSIISIGHSDTLQPIVDNCFESRITCVSIYRFNKNKTEDHDSQFRGMLNETRLAPATATTLQKFDMREFKMIMRVTTARTER